MESVLTSEQEAVVRHPTGLHARVLAVAGSGKTITLAHRIQHLVQEQGVRPNLIRVLMFNRLARRQFTERLTALGLPPKDQPEVHTFHSWAFGFISSMTKRGLLPPRQEFWLDDKQELVWLTAKRAISNLEQCKAIPPNRIEAEEALEAIGLWKGSLIPPARAGCRGNTLLPLVYAEFETLRQQRSALTFDDFLPLAVEILELERSVARDWCERADHVIVDEYQDVNYGQQRLIELLAGQRADVMVVGDDDQTIYEWRGARPNYLIREFRTVFSNKPHADYHLSRSFRFGPLIAQCAHNAITFNTNRVEKPLVAHSAALPGIVQIIEQDGGADGELAEQVVALVKGQNVPPSEIIVLGRMFAQLAGLETEFLARRIPFNVVGQAPFFERREIRTLLDYIRLSQALTDRPTAQAERWLLAVANTPSRKLPRETLSRAMALGQTNRVTVRQSLLDAPLRGIQHERLEQLVAFLDRLAERLATEPDLTAGDLLRWMVETLWYLRHFDDYYGQGETSHERQAAVVHFLVYAATCRMKPREFIAHIEGLDTTRGVPDDQLIVMTTIFRTKGLEYDWVILPQVEEGYTPCTWAADGTVFDTAGIVQEPEPSELVENERRLFCVALTRARRGVFIGTCAHGAGQRRPSRFLDEMQLPATAAVMGQLQRLAAGNSDARQELLTAVTARGGVRKLMRSLVGGYLGDLGDRALTGEVAALVARSKEQPFSYRFAYGVDLAAQAQKPSVPLVLHSAWEQVAF